jgi:two-component sensor histidine kinase
MQALEMNDSLRIITNRNMIGYRVTSCGVYKNEFLWYSTENGELTFLTFAEEKHDPVPLPVYVTNVFVNDKAISTTGTISLDYNQNNCTFHFVGISFKDERAVRYQYRLKGLESSWAPWTDQRGVTYASLEPGSYTFEVRAMDVDNIMSASSASLAFTIHPPLWQLWWFRLLIVAICASMLYWGYRYRLRRLIAMEQMRMRIADDLHDDVGTNLSSLVISSQLLERKLSLNEQEREHLQRIGNTAQRTQELMRDIVWMLNPTNDPMDDFIRKMKETASHILNDIPFTFRISGEPQHAKVDLSFKRNVFLFFKESLNNIASHSCATNVCIECVVNRHTFSLRIHDNGVGFDPALPHQGNGLRTLRTRAEHLGGAFAVESKPGEGTAVCLSIQIT